MDPLKMYFLLKIGIFHGYVSLPEGMIYGSTEVLATFQGNSSERTNLLLFAQFLAQIVFA